MIKLNYNFTSIFCKLQYDISVDLYNIFNICFLLQTQNIVQST